MPAMLDDLLVIPPLRWPDVTIFLISSQATKAIQTTKTTADNLFACLEANERARSVKMASPDLRHRFLTGRAALRSILSAFDGNAIPEDAWRFGRSKNGKPNITAPKNRSVFFNLSYAECFIAIAISGTVDVGVDIEVNHAIPSSELPWHLFSRDEQQLLQATPRQAFQDAFFRLWTLKEAIAKRTGLGFATEFSEINTSALSVVDGLANIADPRHGDADLFHTALPVLDTIIHLAVSKEPTS